MGDPMSLYRLAMAGTVALWMCGCSVGPDYAPPGVEVPATFLPSLRSQQDSSPPADPAPASHITIWWKTLRDPKLDALIERAIAANPEIEAALNCVQQAREHEIVVLGAALPALGLGGSVGRGSGTDSVKSPRIPPTLDSGINTTGFQEIQGVAGFDTGWEFDLFGKNRRALEVRATIHRPNSRHAMPLSSGSSRRWPAIMPSFAACSSIQPRQGKHRTRGKSCKVDGFAV